jgi:hypothetical protein
LVYAEPILRAYLKRWKWEVGQFFSGVDAESPSEDVRRIPGPPDLPRRDAARERRLDRRTFVIWLTFRGSSPCSVDATSSVDDPGRAVLGDYLSK